MSQSSQLEEVKPTESWSARSMVYLLFGTACFVCAVIATLGSMFSSILIAGEMAGLIAAPIFIGLVGIRTPNRIFPAFEALGCTIMLTGLGSVYVGDLKRGAVPSALIHDPVGWTVGVLNLIQLLLSIQRLRPRETQVTN